MTSPPMVGIRVKPNILLPPLFDDYLRLFLVDYRGLFSLLSSIGGGKITIIRKTGLTCLFECRVYLEDATGNRELPVFPELLSY